MTGLALPPAEPPADTVLDVVDRLRTVREHLTEAKRQLHMLEQTFRDNARPPQRPPGSRTYYRIELRVARNRVTLWTREVRALERRARQLGLKP